MRDTVAWARWADNEAARMVWGKTHTVNNTNGFTLCGLHIPSDIDVPDMRTHGTSTCRRCRAAEQREVRNNAS